MKHFLLLAVLVSLSILAGCGSQPAANSTNSNTGDSNAATNVNANVTVYQANDANLPPELRGEPVPVPANSVSGEQRAQDLKKNRRPSEPLAPGIPDEETLRKQMKSLDHKNSNANASAPPAGDDTMTMKKRSTPANADH